jgi:5-methylthioadenosine/S-adenosylhomocysteine deaminase
MTERLKMNNADLLITNARIWEDEDQKFIPDACIAVRDGKILEIGNSGNLAGKFANAPSWNAGGKLLLPGLINTHCHLFQVMMRGLGKDLPFMDWVHGSVRLFMPLLDEEAIYLAAMVGCLEAIRTGTTTLVDFMYANVKPGMADAVLQAFDDCGIRGVLAHGMTDVERLPGSSEPASTYAPVSKRLAELDEMQSKYLAHPRINFMLAPSVMWGMTRAGLAELANYAKAHDMTLTMHLLETADDDDYSQKMYGKRCTPLLDEIGVLEANFLAVHAIRLQDEDFDLLKLNNAKISHNPVANMILGSGVAPIPKLSRLGIQIGLGTDGAASNDSQNMIEVMKSAVLLQKVHHTDPTALTAKQVFRMATSEGAAAIKMDDQIGSIRTGMRADILVVDLEMPNTTPCYDPIASLVYSGSERNINSVFIEGELVLDEGKITHVDEADMMHRAQTKALALYDAAYG